MAGTRRGGGWTELDEGLPAQQLLTKLEVAQGQTDEKKAAWAAGSYSSSRESLSPFLRVTGRMEDTVHRHRVVRILVEDRVGKPSHQPSAVVLVNHAVHLRRAAKGLDTGINGAEEIFPEARTLFFIPGVCFDKV
jgi:hypothetical protein